MGVRARPNLSGEAEDDTIPLMISKLKTAFLPADFQRAERALLARESNLRREIEKLKKENARLLEDNQFRELAMLRVETDSKGVIFEQRRKIRELETQKLKLEALVKSEYEGWKGLISKLEGDAKKLSGEKGVGFRSSNVGVVVKLEREFGANEVGGVASSAGSSILSEGNGGVKVSGIRKSSSEDAGLIDRHNECAPREIEMLCENSEIHKGTGSLGLTGVERKLRVLKRKPASSLSGSDDENRGGNFKKDKNSDSEMKQLQKLSIQPDGPLIKQCTEILDFSGSNDSEIQNLPSHEQVNSRQSEEKIMAEQTSQPFLKALMEGSCSV
ncbi:uncharacterized protein LOC133706621 isoform X2 [Rosa rugosa]|uniref:uncharacterized protein LOC133706621 isoform X2 n=1 Tax=Rosa rugosa TaxID=74645 RepID=UPI002B4159A8|nr:uncharacterized protein LOC133706621 isoform X2 [Rosa rugosa]